MGEADPGLVERARAGDRAAFREIVETHKERLYAVALGMMRDHHDAEDAVQECFLRAYRSLATFQAGAQVGSWLYRIAVNVCLDASRRRRRRGPAIALDER
jgi:RNA polymerase sigma-70 factor, ECF subfamily